MLRKNIYQRIVVGAVLLILLAYFIMNVKDSYATSDVRFMYKMYFIFFNCVLLIMQVIFNSRVLWWIILAELLLFSLWILYTFLACFIDPNKSMIRRYGIGLLVLFSVIKEFVVVLMIILHIVIKPIKRIE